MSVKYTVIYSGVTRQSEQDREGFPILPTDLGVILHKDKGGWIFGLAWATFLCLCRLISTSQGLLLQQEWVTRDPWGFTLQPKMESSYGALIFFYPKTEYKLFDISLCICLCVCCCAPGEWKHRSRHWWSSADCCAESSAVRISERHQELCPPSATEVGAIITQHTVHIQTIIQEISKPMKLYLNLLYSSFLSGII